MAEQEVPTELTRLIEKMHEDYLESELAIATALADAGKPLTVEDLVEATGYTKRTVKKRVESLEERLQGPPLIDRPDEEHVDLHPRVAAALLQADG